MVHAEKTVGSLPENGSGGARGAARGSPLFLDQTEARRPEGPKVWIRHWTVQIYSASYTEIKHRTLWNQGKFSLDKTKASAGQMKFQFLWFLK